MWYVWSAPQVLVGQLAVGQALQPLRLGIHTTTNTNIHTTTTTTNSNNNTNHNINNHTNTNSWVFIKGGCSRRGVQRMGVVLYNKLVCYIMSTTTPCFHCNPL